MYSVKELLAEKNRSIFFLAKSATIQSFHQKSKAQKLQFVTCPW